MFSFQLITQLQNRKKNNISERQGGESVRRQCCSCSAFERTRTSGGTLKNTFPFPDER